MIVSDTRSDGIDKTETDGRNRRSNDEGAAKGNRKLPPTWGDSISLDDDDDDTVTTDGTECLGTTTPRSQNRSSWRQSYHRLRKEALSERSNSHTSPHPSMSGGGGSDSTSTSLSTDSSPNSGSGGQGLGSPSPFMGGTSSIGNASFHSGGGVASPGGKRRAVSVALGPAHSNSSAHGAPSRLPLGDVSTLLQMLVIESDDDDVKSFAMASLEENTMSTEEASTKQADKVVDEAAQLLLLLRQAEEARGNPSNYHSSDDDDEPLMDFGGSNHDGDGDGDGDDDDQDESDGSDAGGDSDSMSGDDSAKWEASVLSESGHSRGVMRKDPPGKVTSVGGSLRRHRQKRKWKRSIGSRRSMNGSRSDLREDLEAQVRERLASEGEEVVEEVHRSIRQSRLEVVEEEESIFLDMVTDDRKDDEGKMSAGVAGDAASPIDEEVGEEDTKRSPLQQIAGFILSKRGLYLVAALVILLLVGNVVMIVLYATG